MTQFRGWRGAGLVACWGLATVAAVSVPRTARADFDVWPAVTVGVGFALHDDHSHIVPSFALDVRVGARFAFQVGALQRRDDGINVIPALGYSLDSLGYHAFNIGAAVGAGVREFAVTYDPRLLLGTKSGVFFVGMRNSLGFRSFFDSLSLEAGHQFDVLGGEVENEFISLVGMNFSAIPYAILTLGGPRE